MSDHGNPTVRDRRLAAELRRLRELSSLTGDEAAQRLGWSGSKLSRIERQRIGVKQADLDRLLNLYQVAEPHRGELLALARESAQKGRSEVIAANVTEEISDYVVAEAEAELLWNWEPQIVPGLLQVEDYARAVVGGVQPIFGMPPGEIERRVAARLARQHVLTGDNPLTLSVVIDESVLRRNFGGRLVMCRQLEHLLESTTLPNIVIHVLPLGEEQPIGTGSFTYMQFAQVHDVRLPDVVILEQLVHNYRLEDEAETFKYRAAFVQLTERALPPDRSRELIADTARELWSQRSPLDLSTTTTPVALAASLPGTLTPG